MTRRVIFAVGDEEVREGEEKLAIVLQRQVSYFADSQGLDGLLRHLGGDSPWREVFEAVCEELGEDNPRKPVSLWRGEGLDEGFKDLVAGLTNFDPARRMTAKEALEHRWFRVAESEVGGSACRSTLWRGED